MRHTQSIQWDGLRRGFGLGLVFSIAEALRNIPGFLMLRYEQPLTITLTSVAFNLLLGSLIGMLAAPFLKLRRGWLWHSGSMLVVISALTVVIRPPVCSTVERELMVAGVVALLYVFSRWLAARPTAARIGIAAGLIVVAFAYGLPHCRTAADRQPEERRLNAFRTAPNVLLIVLDTVRADRLELNGYHRDTFPWLKSFAAEGANFTRALSAASWTVPSHASMFTGLYPSAHGAHHEHRYLDDAQTTLAETLYRHGWTTVALSANPWISKVSGLTQGFAVTEPVWRANAEILFSFAYRVAWKVGLLPQDHCGRGVTEAWLEWLADWEGERPFFALLNYIEPHIPYHLLPPDQFTTFAPENVTRGEMVRASQRMQRAELVGDRITSEDARKVNDLYDAAIRYQGDLVAEAVEALRARGVLDQTIVIVVSDHGDLLGTHGMFTHGRSLSEQLLSVPLVMRYPPRVPRGLVIETPVTTAALMPTILDLVELPAAVGIHTRSFAPLFAGDVATHSPLLAEQYRADYSMVSNGFKPRHVFDRLGMRYRSIEEDGWKLIVDSEGSHWLFRPLADPAESTNLAMEHPEVVERLATHLAALVDAYGLPALDEASEPLSRQVVLDAPTRERLEALGYSG